MLELTRTPEDSKENYGKARQGMAMAWHGKAWQGKATQGKARQGETTQRKAASRIVKPSVFTIPVLRLVDCLLAATTTGSNTLHVEPYGTAMGTSVPNTKLCSLLPSRILLCHSYGLRTAVLLLLLLHVFGYTWLYLVCNVRPMIKLVPV